MFFTFTLYITNNTQGSSIVATEIKIDGTVFNTSLDSKILKKIRSSYTKTSYNFLNRIFGTNDRIQIPFEMESEKYENNSDYLSVKEILENNDYTIQDYFEGTCVKKDDTRIYKIGRILNRLNASAEVKEHFQNGDTRANRKTTEEMVITISKNMYDVAFMSYNRGWSSCMDIYDGCNKNYVYTDLKKGTCIAYLHKKSDVAIEHPVCRILLKKFRKGKSRLHENAFLFMENRPYGVAPTNFTRTIEKWLSENFSTKEDMELNIEDGVYNDGIGSIKAIVSQNSPKIKGSAKDRTWIAKFGTNHHRRILIDNGESKDGVLKTIVDYSYNTDASLAFDALIGIKDSNYMNRYSSLITQNFGEKEAANNIVFSKFVHPSELEDKQVIRNFIHNIHNDKKKSNILLKHDNKYIPHYIIWHGGDDIVTAMYKRTKSNYTKLEVIRRVPHQIPRNEALKYIEEATFFEAFVILLHDRYDRIDNGKIDEKDIKEYLFEKYPNMKKLIEYAEDDSNNHNFSLENRMFEYLENGIQWSEDDCYNAFGIEK